MRQLAASECSQWLALWALAAALLLAASTARASDESTRAQIEQRIKLSATLLADGAMLQRVAASGNATAIASLDEGRLHHAHARDQFAQGNLSAARKAVDDAIRLIGTARRLAPDAAGRQAGLRQRYEQHLASTERLVEAWRVRAAQGGAAEAGAVAAAIGLIDGARQHAAAGRFEEAQTGLAAAEKDLLEGMRRLLGSSVDYSPRFANAQDEFIHELARHQSLIDLLPVAIRDLRPQQQALALIEQFRSRSATLHAQAVHEHSAGQTERALPLVREAIAQLTRAMLAAGLVLPVETRN